MPQPAPDVPVSHLDPVNQRILAISEDKIEGFVRDPMVAIAEKSGVDVDTVIERIRAMLRAGTIRRVRQTLMSTNLAFGALVAWQVPQETPATRAAFFTSSEGSTNGLGAGFGPEVAPSA
jgi:DNA-binding Lrp family transcriptional regulator